MLVGKQSWLFENQPVIKATGVTGGPFEARGKISEDFDILHDELWMGEQSYEKAHKLLIEEAVDVALKKAELTEKEIQFFIGGDLINQITPTNFAARKFAIPYFGLFNACATSMEGLALASLIINHNGADYTITGAASHNAAAERQFRYPTEYGGQKPPTAQWTVTGAGYAIVGKQKNKEKLPKVTTATIGKVIDMGLTDPFNMGAAMAPAAADTIEAHFRDLNRKLEDYDLIVTGDLGKIGYNIAIDLLHQKGIMVDENNYKDCGLLIYSEEQEDVLAGASGAASSATVIYGHLLNEMKKGKYKKILCVATGALLSPMTVQQKESIPCIAHAVSIEFD
ncbi:stage V sporulation protein AD [Bacillus kwashiorkori]|uniref:stage V sporulation protein AD n=1 Tax=Bacillus kwashiorkori TaxID=1522318 RepID=UPI00078193DD|nr:stage V sporulation protein AD [Bacillus kwashiorkori]